MELLRKTAKIACEIIIFLVFEMSIWIDENEKFSLNSYTLNKREELMRIYAITPFYWYIYEIWPTANTLIHLLLIYHKVSAIVFHIWNRFSWNQSYIFRIILLVGRKLQCHKIQYYY